MPVNWPEIRNRVIAGESYRAISKDLTARGEKISHVAIGKRSRNEGWKPGGKETATETVTPVTGAVTPDNPASHYLDTPPEKLHRPVMFKKDTPAIRAQILQDIGEGLPDVFTANRAGIDPDTLKRWQDADPDFAAEVATARANRVKTRLKRIDGAGERGDWKADAWLIEKSPETRDMFGNQQGSGSGSINIILNVPVPQPIPTETLEAIDAEVS